MKLIDLINRYVAIEQLSELPVSAMVAFELSEVIDQLKPHVDRYNAVLRRKLKDSGLSEYVDSTAQLDDRKVVKAENPEKISSDYLLLAEEMTKVRNAEVESFEVRKIPLSKLVDSEGKPVTISGRLMGNLKGWLIIRE